MREPSPLRLPLTGWMLGLLLLLGVTIAMFVASAQDARQDPLYSSRMDGCADRGGMPAKGAFGEDYCRIVYPDGGKTCSGKSDCTGLCTRRSEPPGPRGGQCQSENVQFGCFSVIEAGQVAEVVCRD